MPSSSKLDENAFTIDKHKPSSLLTNRVLLCTHKGFVPLCVPLMMPEPILISSKKDEPQTMERPWIEQRFFVEGECHGLRLDQFLQKKIRRLSRQRIQRVIHGECYLDGHPAKPSRRVQVGQEVMFRRPPPQEPEVPRDILVLKEDEYFYLIHKPAGLPIHPTARYHHSTLTSVLKEKFPGEHLQVAHRLDRETSGVMIVARGKHAASVLKQAFAKRHVQKTYLAIVHGVPKDSTFSVHLPLGPADGKVRVKMAPRTPAEGGLPAETHFHCLQSFGEYTLIECKPVTGRQHQIRVHLSAMGHPIVGDKLYPDEELFISWAEEGPEAISGKILLDRHALHAYKVGFEHPIHRSFVEGISPLPQDLRTFMERHIQPSDNLLP